MARLAHLCKDRIQKTDGYEQWAKRYITMESVSDTGEARFFCIAHDNKNTSSASFNINSGLWKCQSITCNAEGDVIDLYRIAHGIASNGEAIKKLALELGIIAEISDAVIQQHHEFLFAKPQLLQKCCEMLGLKASTLKHFRIGYVRRDPHVPRITIPIRGEDGEWADVRLYNRNDEKAKMLHWAEGHGAVRFFPMEHQRQCQVLVGFEGEKDCMRATEFGVQGAFAFTGGAGKVPDNFAELFKGKTVFLCYDVDEAGKKGAERAAKKIAMVAESVSIIVLPSEGLPANGDFSDWANLGHDMDSWEALVAQAVKVEPDPNSRMTDDFEDDGEAVQVSFKDLDTLQVFGQQVRFLGHAMGKSHGLVSYQVPTEVIVDCPRNQKKLCDHCSLFELNAQEKPWRLPINYRSERALEMFRVSVEQQGHALKRMLGVNRRCEVIRIQTTKRQSIQHLLISPPVELSQMREDYNGIRKAYYHGDPIQDNRDYWFKGSIQADPKSQEMVLNLHAAEPARNALDNFVLNEEVLDAVEWFQPDQGQTLEAHLAALHEYIEQDTGIWGQHALQQVILDTIFSALEFDCGNRQIENGWVETLMIGDTGLAKSTLARRMMQMIDVGEFISAENVSLAGLIGGIEFIDKVPITKWGALPRNHRGFVVLDEIDEMQKKNRDITSQLTALRSSGRAEITKIHNAKTPACVRMLWITNPEDGRTIASYNGACRAIEGVIRSRQDIARFTKAIAVASESASVETITQLRERHERPGVRRHFNNLAILVWSLARDQISFTQDAQLLLQSETIRLTSKYHESIPLMEKGRAFDKLAKLSVPMAALCGNFRETDGKMKLYVGVGHVQQAIRHLEQCYDHVAMGFDQYSKVEYARQTIPNEIAVIKALEACMTVSRPIILRHFLVHSKLTRGHLDELLGDRIASMQLWSALLANNCLQHTGSSDTATKTKAFASLIERLIRDESKEHTHAV
jgi:hypothetical protein